VHYGSNEAAKSDEETPEFLRCTSFHKCCRSKYTLRTDFTEGLLSGHTGACVPVERTAVPGDLLQNWQSQRRGNLWIPPTSRARAFDITRLLLRSPGNPRRIVAMPHEDAWCAAQTMGLLFHIRANLSHDNLGGLPKESVFRAESVLWSSIVSASCRTFPLETLS